MARNRCVLIWRYARHEPRWIARLALAMVKCLILIVLYEPQKTRKLCAYATGVLHAISGRRGPWPGA
jgi:hypothetical protein